MKRRLLIVLFIISLSLLSFASEPNKTVLSVSEDIATTQKEDQSFEELLNEAESNDVNAQFELGVKYYKGQGVKQDYEKAVIWYRKAADQKFAKAQYNLGMMYAKGKGVSRDTKEAAKWCTKAAEQGNTDAQYFMGLLYSVSSPPKDYVEAYKWLNLSASQGNQMAKDGRDVLRTVMSSSQIAEAQRLSREFVPRKVQADQSAASSADNIDSQIKGFDTGFFISKSGLLVTAAHVVKDVSSVKVYWLSNEYPAEKVFVDETLDVAVLKVLNIQLPRLLSLASSSTVKTGDAVFTLGFPQVQLQGIEPKYTDGSISSLSGKGNDPKYFQISVPVQPGNSGGPLLNNEGQVIGLINSRLDNINALLETGAIPQNVNYALKSSFILPLLESLPDIQLEKPSKLDKAEAIDKAKNAIGLVISVGN